MEWISRALSAQAAEAVEFKLDGTVTFHIDNFLYLITMKASDPRLFAPPYNVDSSIQQAEGWARSQHPKPQRRLPGSAKVKNLLIHRRDMLPLLFGVILTVGLGFGGVAWYFMAQWEAPPAPSLASPE